MMSVILAFLLVLLGTPVLSEQLMDTESFGGHLEVDYIAPVVYSEIANRSFGGHLEVDIVGGVTVTIRNDGENYICWKGNNGTLSDAAGVVSNFDESTEYVAVWDSATWNDTHWCWVKYYGDGSGSNRAIHQLDIIKIYLTDSGTQTINMFGSGWDCNRTIDLSYLGSTGNKGYNYTCFCCDISAERDNTLSWVASQIGLQTGEVISYWNNTSYTWNAWIEGITPASMDTVINSDCPIFETKVHNDYSWVISCP